MNVPSKDKQALLIAGLTEGNSFKSLYRLTGVHPDTIMRLSVRVGEGCARLLDERMKGLAARAQWRSSRSLPSMVLKLP